jgi:hypothetical protein
MKRREIERRANIEQALDLLDRVAPWLIPLVIIPSLVVIAVLETATRWGKLR